MVILDEVKKGDNVRINWFHERQSLKILRLIRSLCVAFSFLIIFQLQPTKVFGESKGHREYLIGNIGASEKWGAGWLDLYRPVDFKVGDKIRLTIGGNAKRILVRLLPTNAFPNEPVGIIGNIFEVPPDRIIEIVLSVPGVAPSQVTVKIVNIVKIHAYRGQYGIF